MVSAWWSDLYRLIRLLPLISKSYISKKSCETQPSNSKGWVALSSLVWVCPSRLGLYPLYDVWNHTNQIVSVFIADFSPFYCCLVSIFATIVDTHGCANIQLFQNNKFNLFDASCVVNIQFWRQIILFVPRYIWLHFLLHSNGGTRRERQGINPDCQCQSVGIRNGSLHRD